MTELPEPIHTGKVRALHDAGQDSMIMFATDQISAFDFVLTPEIPDKGKILTRLSAWWFGRLSHIVRTHFITADVDAYPPPFKGVDELRGRSMLIHRLTMLPVECVARAYLSGSALVEYRRTGSVWGNDLPAGLTEGSELPEPIFTPTTKGGDTGHDEPLTFDDLVALIGPDLAATLRRLTLEILAHGRAVCEPRGIIVADTKLEFGLDPATDDIVLADEVLTPDSSRFWDAEKRVVGTPQPSFDKQPVRDWLVREGWDKRPPVPTIPDDVVRATRQRYVEAYERITGTPWTD